MESNLHSLFFLGGYDLEMLTIKQMLEGREGCAIMDKHLRWDNACLSVYQEELSRYADTDVGIYGIELQEDIAIPSNYHRIDHHNDWADKSSSLEQVAEIVGVELNHYQLLVAANDRGYIPAMGALGASKEEIDDIRKKDRAAQGVSEEDERLAEMAIAENLNAYKGVTIVKAFSSFFSPICDRLFPYQRLLIYTDSEWMFYGEGTTKLAEELTSEIKDRHVYHGGGPAGYIGAVRDAFTTKDIYQFVNIIKQRYE